MKKIITLFFALIMAHCAWAYSFTVGGIYYNITSSNKVGVTFKTDSWTPTPEYTGSITIPSSVIFSSITYSVTSIEEGAFSYCYNMTSITLPSSVTTIGVQGFDGCWGLTTINMPSSITSIGEKAFRGCTHLTSIAIPISVSSIGNNTFTNCSGLTSITIPSSIKTIGNQSFSGCTNITSITIPSSVTSIGNNAFSDCTALTSVSFNPTNCTNMSNSSSPVFYGCTSLKSLNIGSNVTTIPTYAFYGCSGFTSVIIPNSVTSIGDNAFANCTGLASVTIGSSVSSIGSYAFFGCVGLTSIHALPIVPVDLTSSSYVFYNVDQTSCILYVPVGSKDVYKSANQWRSFSNIKDGLPIVQTTIVSDIKLDNAISGGSITDEGISPIIGRGICWSTSPNPTTADNKTLDGVGIGSFTSVISGLTTNVIYHVRAYATNNLGTSYGSDITFTPAKTINVVVPGSLNSLFSVDEKNIVSNLTITGNIDARDFVTLKNMPKLSVLDINAVNITAYTGSAGPASSSSTVYPSACIPNLAFNNHNNLTNVIIPNSATRIGTSAFQSCVALKSVSMGDSLIYINESAFAFCSSLTNLIIPNSVSYLGNYAFGHCFSLKSITIGSGVNSIASYAFYQCTGLTSIYAYPAPPPNLSSSTTVFYNVNFAGCSLYVPGSSLNDYKLANQWSSFVNIKNITPIVTTKSVTNITSSSATVSSIIDNPGISLVILQGVCWSINPNPTTLDNKTTESNNSTEFTSSINGLLGATTYYVRAYATNNSGISYGSEIKFKTLGIAPTVSTSSLLNVSTNSVSVGGNVISAGTASVTKRGVCWSTSVNPTVSDSLTNDGNGIGSYLSSIKGLLSSVQYHIRAYATNSVGTAYGEDLTFKTLGNTSEVIVEISKNPSGYVCKGTNVTYNALTTNGGTKPSYQWKVNGTNTGTNTTSFNSSSLLNGDIVTCVLTSNASYVTNNTSTSNSVLSTIYSFPTKHKSYVEISVCSNCNVMLDAIEGATYLWSPVDGLSALDIQKPMANPKVNTLYTVNVTDENGCKCTDTVMVFVKPPFSIETINDTTIQKGESLTLGIKPILYDVNIRAILDNGFDPRHFIIRNSKTGEVVFRVSENENNYYNWRGSTISTTEKFVCGEYYIDALRAWGYSITPSIGSQLDNNGTFIVGGNDYVYSWTPETGLDNPSIANPIATPLVDTRYIVTVNTNQGCYANDTINVKVTNNTGLNQQKASNDYVIYPNPVSESFQINEIDEIVTIRLTDVSGRTMLLKQVFGNEQIFISSLPKGLYIVKIYTNKGGIERKLVKK